MKSPFPGMDPYIEACGLWGDFQLHLICNISNHLAGRLPRRLVPRLNRRCYVVYINRDGQTSWFHEDDESPEPQNVKATDEIRETYMEIKDLDNDHRVLTRVEVLYPEHRQRGTPSWAIYQESRNAIMERGISLVEIDLLRAGEPLPVFESPRHRVIKPSFGRPMSPVTIPLGHSWSEVSVDLQPMIDDVYSSAKYGWDIDYARPLVPPLNEELLACLQRRVATRN